MLVHVEFSYNFEKDLAKKGREVYEAVKAAIPNVPFPEWKADKDAPEYFYERSNVFIELETDGPILTEHEISFTVKRFKQNYFIDKVFDETRKNRGMPEGSSIHVHIPNIGLLMIDEVDWLEDACTQELQSRLDEGWRILAVCPPNAQRRPDYILGRRKEREQ